MQGQVSIDGKVRQWIKAQKKNGISPHDQPEL